jgi:hypothetical protein
VITIEEIGQEINDRGFKLYTGVYELNIIGVRSSISEPSKFDDWIHVVYRDEKNKWQHFSARATTDPGTYWLQHPKTEAGAAILTEGQYEGCYQIGLHQGKYKALIQKKPVNILRDYDRGATLDFYNGTAKTGMFGINIHRATENGTSLIADKASAGCQVFANSGDFDKLMQLCELHRARHGNTFTYTLLDKRSQERATKRHWLYTAAVATATVAISSYLIFKLTNHERHFPLYERIDEGQRWQ